MKLYDYLKLTECDYDTCDTVFDALVTVCFIEDEDGEKDNYYKFCLELMKKVEVEKINGDIIIAKWTELIQNNMEKFKEFTEKHWRYTYEDDEDDEDEFIYQWINEFQNYLAGYVAESFYGTLVEFVGTLKA